MSRIIFIIIIFFLLVLIFLFLIWPKYRELAEFNAKIEAKETEIRFLKKHFADLKKLSQELEEYQTQIQKIDSALPLDASLTMLSVINFLQNEAFKNGLYFEELTSSIISPKTTAKSKTEDKETQIVNINEIKIDFKVSGSYSAFKNFLKTLEKSAKLIEVENISFSFKDSEIFSFSLGIKTYSY